MPTFLTARPPRDAQEARHVRTLARSRHAPADWIQRARMIVRSWAGLRTTAIAAELGCNPQTVRKRLTRFNAEGVDGFGDRPGAGRKRRLTEAERSAIIQLVGTPPPGRIVRQADGRLAVANPDGAAHWTLDALTDVAHKAGITVKRSQVRRILLADGVRWRSPRRWIVSKDPNFSRKRTAVVACYTPPPVHATTICLDELGPVGVKSYPPPAGWSLTGHRIPYQQGFDWTWSRKIWVYGALRVQDGHALTFTASRRDTAAYLRLLHAVEQANPTGELYLIADNLASHKSIGVQLWFAEHPRVHAVYLPTGAAWLNLIEPWWRLLRRAALAGQTFEHGSEIEQAIAVATHQLNCRAHPWVWGRPPQQPRYRRRRFVYSL